MSNHLENVPIRNNARIVLLNTANEVLLMKIQLPEYSFWCTIGGEIEPNESPLEAIRREVLEETGFREDDISWGGAIWYGEHVLERKGVPTLHKETFFVGRTSRLDVSADNLSDEEQDLVKGFKWWSLAELSNTSEFIVPPKLGNYLKSLIKDGAPEETLTIDLENAPPK